MLVIEKRLPGVDLHALERFVTRARRAAGVRGAVDVLVASSARLRSLNRQYRGKDRSTDVLSFPSRENATAGDIAISIEVGARNARRLRHSLGDELMILVLHGMLHLAGYDHESDHGEMVRKEERLRRRLGLPTGLIERTLDPPKPKSTTPGQRKKKRRRTS